MIRSQGLSSHEWKMCLQKRDPKELPCLSYHMRTEQEVTVCEPENGPYQNFLALLSWNSQLQNCEKVSIVYKLPSLCSLSQQPELVMTWILVPTSTQSQTQQMPFVLENRSILLEYINYEYNQHF